MPRAVAERLGLPVDFVESIVDRAPGFGERLLAGLSGSVPEVAQPGVTPLEDVVGAYRREIERIINAAAAVGDVVIMGRFGNVVLGPRADLVRVFVYAPEAWRIDNVSRSLSCDTTSARFEIARIDHARRTFAREQYALAWGDIRHYDLAVDTARYGVDGAAAVIAAAVEAARTAA